MRNQRKRQPKMEGRKKRIKNQRLHLDLNPWIPNCVGFPSSAFNMFAFELLKVCSHIFTSLKFFNPFFPFLKCIVLQHSLFC
ncbi:hypothetical protein CRYUN_Cryun06bG0054000 [Craigia yunnanensis]